MVSEVETILNEIRERVRADHEQRPASGTLVVQGETGAESPANPTAENRSRSVESLARVSAHLTTTARAWDRLPPLYSNRSGMTARVELWIKARLKSLSRWFTWEQVNFNAAVHQALSDTLEALRTHEQELSKIRDDLMRETEARLARFEQAEREILALRAHVQAQMADIRSRVSNLTTQSVAIEARLTEANASQAELNIRMSEISAARSNTAKEIDERLSALAADLREEQRVCFKQLSLETSEAAVLEDRGRRAIESRLEKLEQSGRPRNN
jgi:DNA repair ATPase RecN